MNQLLNTTRFSLLSIIYDVRRLGILRKKLVLLSILGLFVAVVWSPLFAMEANSKVNPSNRVFGIGAFLLAGSEVAKLDRLPIVGVKANNQQEPNVATNTIDDDLNTRWSCSGDGDDCKLWFDLGSVQTVSGVKIAWFRGDERQAFFELESSEDDNCFENPGSETWTPIPGITESSGMTLALERFNFDPVQARCIRYVGQGNSANRWNSITEFRFIYVGLKNPVLEYDDWSIKDYGIMYKDETFYLFFSAFYPKEADRDSVRCQVVEVTTEDFITYSDPILKFDGREEDWKGMCSPDVVQVGSTYYLTFNSWGDKDGKPNQLFYKTSTDLVNWSSGYTPLAANLTSGKRAIDSAMAYENGKYYVFWKDQANKTRLAVSSSMSGDFEYVGSGYPALLMADGEDNGLIHENYHFMKADGKWYVLTTDYTPHNPYLYTMEGEGSQDADWLSWGSGSKINISKEDFNTKHRANAAVIVDWRDHEDPGYFYLLYAGNTETSTFGRRGHNKLGLSRNTVLSANGWTPPGVGTAQTPLGDYKSADSGNWDPLESDYGVYRLWDGITSTKGANARNTDKAWVEFDFGEKKTITKARVFGDNSGNNYVGTWTLQYWNGTSYVDKFTDENCQAARWFEENVNEKTSKIKVLFTKAKNATGIEVMELELYSDEGWDSIFPGN